MIELVNKATGERIDLRFVQGLRIECGPLPPEIEAELRELARFREFWQWCMRQSLGVPEWLLSNDRSDTTAEP